MKSFCIRAMPVTIGLLLVSVLEGQTGDSSVGYLRIFTDADKLEIFVDGRSVGYTPVLEHLPLKPGYHSVSFFAPDFKWRHWTHRQKRVLVDIIQAGTYHVLIKPEETVKIHMAWHELENDLLRATSGRVISGLVGMVMVAVVLLLYAQVV